MQALTNIYVMLNIHLSIIATKVFVCLATIMYVVQTIVANESPLILVYRASMAYSWTGVSSVCQMQYIVRIDGVGHARVNASQQSKDWISNCSLCIMQ